jgi:adenylate cyclase
MAIEIERKFLVEGTSWRQSNGVRLSQCYLNRDKHRTVRIRIAGGRAFLTVKSATHGATRAEFEYEIPVADAEQMMRFSDGPSIEKIRHTIVHDGFKWEVDEFLGDNAGLVLAEIELASEDQPFSRPPWLGREVTHDSRFYNSSLAANPYTQWCEDRG